MRFAASTMLALLVLAPELGAQNASDTILDRQIRTTQAATRALASTTAAHAAGFEPVFGWIPTMGVHWVNNERMAKGKAFELTAPAQLMFSPIGGRDSLVGAAYAYLAPVGDSSRPTTFAGDPPWHEHPNLAPPGQTLVMLHVWFVPSPDGPFAGHNHNLPFWAVGLTPPNADRLRHPMIGPRIRKTAFVLAEVADTTGLFPVLAAREPARTKLRALRDSVRALIPSFASADSANDWPRWDAAAERAASLWDEFRATYLDAVLVPTRRPRVERLMDDMVRGAHDSTHRHP